MQDEQIIELYWQRKESAIKESSRKYGAYCFTVANNILSSSEDSEECVNDTWLRAWDSIPPQKPGKLKYFLARITRNLSLDKIKTGMAKKRGKGELYAALDELSECVAGSSDVEGELEGKELAVSINRFLHELSEREANVFLRRYFYVDSVTDIAKQYGIKESYVFVLLSRTREKLKEYLGKEGYQI